MDEIQLQKLWQVFLVLYHQQHVTFETFRAEINKELSQ